MLKVFHWMVNWLNKDITKKIDEIIETVENSSEYQKYLLLQEEMKKNKKLTKLLNEVRLLQKDYVHHLKSKEELDKKMQELSEYPLYREYQNTLDDLNNTYTIIENRINNYFYEKLN